MNRYCPGDESWQLYLLGSDKVNRPALEEHLGSCSVCRFLLARRREELDAFMSVSLSRASALHLSLLPDSVEPSLGPVMLAAKGNQPASGGESLTLATPDRGLLLKAIRDTRTHELWLYLMADDPDLCRRVMVTPFGKDDAFVTDDQGRINLGAIDWPSRENWSANVRLPLAAFRLTPQDFSADNTAPVVLRSPEGDEIQVRLVGTSTGRRLEIEFVRLASIRAEADMRVAVRLGDRPDIIMLTSPREPKLTVEHVTGAAVMEVLLFQ